MWVLVAGPHTSAAPFTDGRSQTLRAPDEAVFTEHHEGHAPIVGVNVPLSVVDGAPDDMFDELRMPLSFAVADRDVAIDPRLTSGDVLLEAVPVSRTRRNGHPVVDNRRRLAPGDLAGSGRRAWLPGICYA
jgi:hypothetical protein